MFDCQPSVVTSHRRGKAMSRLLTVVAACVLLVVPSVSAWHSKGHMAVAAVAYQLLTPSIQARVQQLLRRNPAFDEWNNRLAGAPESDKPALRFALAAGWPDDIKNDSHYT